MNRIRVIIPSVILAAVLFMLPACGNSKKDDPANDAGGSMSSEERTDVSDRAGDGNSGGLDRDGDGIADEMEKAVKT